MPRVVLCEFFLPSVNVYFFQKTNEIIKKLGVDKGGYRIVTNDGKNANQEVPHFHIH